VNRGLTHVVPVHCLPFSRGPLSPMFFCRPSNFSCTYRTLETFLFLLPSLPLVLGPYRPHCASFLALLSTPNPLYHICFPGCADDLFSSFLVCDTMSSSYFFFLCSPSFFSPCCSSDSSLDLTLFSLFLISGNVFLLLFSFSFFDFFFFIPSLVRPFLPILLFFERPQAA